MNHAVLVLKTERQVLRDNHRHLRCGGEPHLTNLQRADLMAEILRELRDLDIALFALGAAARVSQVTSLNRCGADALSHSQTPSVKLQSLS